MEEAQWFYEDFVRPLDPTLPSLSLRAFSMRIFQHCPLFSQWSAQHHTSAFAEFLAYKSRVPVRGAIMLNEAMDEVVLVKGWKKGANWSFPRGKINKDENDMDCAIREVYEETGFDLRAAGLVKEEKEMKYIEVTMREQHMRLYVFRSVPKDANFEPKTRKEISKIGWYRLTDLPTLKKNKHQEGTGESLAVNANKFYMVAPFLVPLKKWIAQQRKKHIRASSSADLPHPTLLEETATDDEIGYVPGDSMPQLEHTGSYGPSNLPEVTVSTSQPPMLNPTSQLKALLNVNTVRQVQPDPITVSAQQTTNLDDRSSALLALLRQGTVAEPLVHQSGVEPLTPLEQHILRPPHVSSLLPPPASPIQSSSGDFQTRRSHFQQSPQPHDASSIRPVTHASPQTSIAPIPLSGSRIQPPAPYHRTGDPQFAQQRFQNVARHSIPPASALPKLTNHTRALLDFFKACPTTEKRAQESPLSPTHRPRLPSETSEPESHPMGGAAPAQGSRPFSALLQENVLGKSVHPISSTRPSLPPNVDFRELSPKPSQHSLASVATLAQVPTLAPVELATQLPRLSQGNQEKPYGAPLHFSQRTSQGKQKPVPTEDIHRQSTSREGHTSATISGPLNQPQFEGLKKSSRRSSISKETGRSPNTKNRTLFDPTAPSTLKILSRPERLQQSPNRSSKAVKPKPILSSKPLSTPSEVTIAFQPQILRRPKSESVTLGKLLSEDSAALVFSAQQETSTSISAPPQLSVQSTALLLPNTLDRQSSQIDAAHRQNLLSLFSRPAVPAEKTSRPQDLSGAASATASQVVSPLTEKGPQGLEAISARSRIGSVASLVSGGSQPALEKRQTAAGDRAFLLGYLGRIASQEG